MVIDICDLVHYKHKQLTLELDSIKKKNRK